MSTVSKSAEETGPRLRRALGLWDLVLYGVIVVQPTAPMPLFGVVMDKAHGHAVTTILFAMLAMLFTAISYGRMAAAYPSAGSAFTYVGREIHPALGYVTGWSMAMDYIINPLICTVWCSQAMLQDPLLSRLLPAMPFPAWAAFFALLFTALNLRGIKSTARTNQFLAAGMGVVIVIFLLAAIRYIFGLPSQASISWTRPFYDPATFQARAVLTGTSLAALTYMGFDSISTLSEEVRDPRRNILRATVLTCVATGLLASIEVFAAQVVWPSGVGFGDKPETAYAQVGSMIAGHWLATLVNVTLLVATIGSGMGTQLGAARLLYGMGRGNALPKRFFAAIDAKRRIPRNNILLIGLICFGGAMLINYDLGAQMLNFGAFIGFMGVNAAAFRHYWLRGGAERRWADAVLPAIGFTFCLIIFLSLQPPAKIWGGAWVLVGIVYGAIRTRGFRGKLVSFDVPPEG
ncbi:MAG: APC family permease [Acidobacteriota bacterium]